VLRTGASRQNALSTLGLGRPGALVLSGSPVAATALALVAAGERRAQSQRTELEGFTMLTAPASAPPSSSSGRGRVRAPVGEGKRRAPLSTAVLALTATAVVYVPAAFLGAALLSWGPFASLELGFPGQLVDLIDLVYGGVVEGADRSLPSFLVFVAGLGALLRVQADRRRAPDLDAAVSRQPDWLQRKWPMFDRLCHRARDHVGVVAPRSRSARREGRRPARASSRPSWRKHHDARRHHVSRLALDSPAAVRIVLAE
jgi:hypothetical protein